jgi:hypothetical protein
MIAAGEESLSSILGRSLDSPFLRPVIFRGFLGAAGNAEPLQPPAAHSHHYVRVQAAGALGATLQVAAESMDASGNQVTPKGKDYPPIFISDATASVGIGQEDQPAVTSILVKRLSDNPNSPLFCRTRLSCLGSH